MKSHPEQIDIAWFKDKSQKYPIFIFEIESKNTTSAFNNPIKIFEKERKAFEKPLFFFHIFIKSSKDETKIKTLLTMYGKHNYCIYEMNKNQQLPLLSDIIMQHRRISRDIDTSEFLNYICKISSSFEEVEQIIEIIEDNDFNDELCLLNEYLILSRYNKIFIDTYAKKLSKIRQKSKSVENDAFTTYLSFEWCWYINCCILKLNGENIDGEFIN